MGQCGWSRWVVGLVMVWVAACSSGGGGGSGGGVLDAEQLAELDGPLGRLLAAVATGSPAVRLH